MAPYAGGKTEARDTALRSGVLEGIMDSRGTKSFDEIEQTLPISRRNIAVIAADRDNPLLLLDRENKSAAATFRRAGKKHNTVPRSLPIMRSLDDSRRIGLINSDLCLLRSLQTKSLQKLQGQAASSGRLSHKISIDRMASPILAVTSNSLHA